MEVEKDLFYSQPLGLSPKLSVPFFEKKDLTRDRGLLGCQYFDNTFSLGLDSSQAVNAGQMSDQGTLVVCSMLGITLPSYVGIRINLF